jgi:hypothetical protein
VISWFVRIQHTSPPKCLGYVLMAIANDCD